MQIQQVLTGLPLMKFGFIHVTGLIAKRDKEELEIKASPNDYGKTDSNNGMEVAVTLDGEVWLRHYSATIRIHENKDFLALIKTLCPKKGDVFVPCSNGEGIASYALFSRVSDPYWTGSQGREFVFHVPHANVNSSVPHEEPALA